MAITLVQLPFPSTTDPHPLLVAYYKDYSARFSQLVNNYFVPDGALWEMPLWVAHVAGMLKAIGKQVDFVDLSTAQPSADRCAHLLAERTRVGSIVMLSPLAQNFELAKEVSRRLIEEGRKTVIGGNMAPLADASSASVIYRGVLDADNLTRVLNEIELGPGVLEIQLSRRGRVTWQPDYSLLRPYAGKVPLLRLNASHGCLFECNFCGDAWSSKLHVVEPSALEAEVQQLEELFPDTRLIYIGDKTFGQSPEAVTNLLDVFSGRPHHRFVVQTHINVLSERLIETMWALGVVVLEMGFESGDPSMLRESGKIGASIDRYEAMFERLNAAGIRVVLNVLGGLPLETPASHQQTIAAIERWAGCVWLYNLYNFVPYPLTPYFPTLRSRIFNWNFAEWREDAPPVFTPYHQSVEASWQAFLEKVRVAHSTIQAPALLS